MKNQVSHNIFFSILDTIVSTILAFILYKVIIEALGIKMLGAWSIVLAATSITQMSDFGISGGVTKFVAKYLAINQPQKASQVVTTAAFSLACIVGLIYIIFYPVLQIIITALVDKEIVPIVTTLLPYAVISFYINIIGSAFQSGLDGCNKISTKRKISTCCNLLYFILSIFFVHNYGIIGLAYSQIIQSVCVNFLCGIYLKKEMKILSFSPANWKKNIFLEIFSYGTKFQAISILVILSDPMIKFLLSKYGGLTSVGYYEVAGKIVLKVRALIINVNQVMIPLYAKFIELDSSQVVKTYNFNLRCMLFTSYIIFPFLVIIAPVLSVYFFSAAAPDFIFFFILIVMAHFSNIIVSPAYFANLGIGRLNENLYSHLVSSLSCVALGLIFGSLMGGYGVALSYLLSTCLGSITLLYLFHNSNKISYKVFFQVEDIRILLSSITAVILTSCLLHIGRFLLPWYWIELFRILSFITFTTFAIRHHTISKNGYDTVKTKLLNLSLFNRRV
jgi:O-antigen/teichoic acid export membrane protein